MPETGDRFEKRERQSGYRYVYFVKCSQFTDNVLLHRRFTLRTLHSLGNSYLLTPNSYLLGNFSFITSSKYGTLKLNKLI